MTIVKLNSFRNTYGPTEDSHKRFVENAVRLIEDTVNQASFINAVKEYPFTVRRFHTDDDGIFISPTNDMIIDKIISGKERQTDPDDSIDLEIELMGLGDDETGRVSPPSPAIALNTKHFVGWYGNGDLAILASTIMHEWMHVCGFRHASGDIDNDDVPYGIGKLVFEFAGGSSIMSPLGFAKRIFNSKIRRQRRMYKDAVRGLRTDVYEGLPSSHLPMSDNDSLQ